MSPWWRGGATTGPDGALLFPFRAHKPRETSTERAARKAERKAQKQADAALLLPQDARQAAAEVSFYSSTDNPFHDANLADKFVWGKKREKERKQGMTPEEAKRRDMERQIESQVSSLTLGWAGYECELELTWVHDCSKRLSVSTPDERSAKPTCSCERRSLCGRHA